MVGRARFSSVVEVTCVVLTESGRAKPTQKLQINCATGQAQSEEAVLKFGLKPQFVAVQKKKKKNNYSNNQDQLVARQQPRTHRIWRGVGDASCHRCINVDI